jgi:phospholipid/cholesterol/gamma-HCH transport system substrate-binding protein
LKPTRIIAVVVVLALVAAAAVTLINRAATKTVSAVFTQAVQIYPNDEVRVRGVKVGLIDAITPVPGGVRLDMTYDADAPISADAKAAIVAPTLLNRRYVQFAPSSHTGPQLPDGAALGLDRTAVPVEYDQIKEQLSRLSSTLGPGNGQLNGALTRVLGTTADNLRGNGHDLNEAVTNVARALGTLSDGRDDLYGTIRNLNTVVGALRQADSDVAGFDRELATTSRVLADSSGDLHTALDRIDGSFADLKDFLAENRGPLTDDVRRLAAVADNVSDNRQAVADVLQRLPNLLTNFQNIHDGFSGAIGGALAADTPTEEILGLALVGAFVGGLPVVVPGAGSTLQEERNGSANYIEPRDGQCKRPAPHPKREPVYNPVVTPPRPPDGGVGTQPYFTRNTSCQGIGDGSGGTISPYHAANPLGTGSPLLAPVAPAPATAAPNPLTALFNGGR